MIKLKENISKVVLLKRVFIGSFIRTPEFNKSYSKIKKDFGGVISGKWVYEKNLHITYSFLGNITDSQLISVRESLSELLNVNMHITLELRGLGVFPSAEKPRIFFVKVSENKSLNHLYNQIRSRLEKIGFKGNEKKFIPHITLKRIKRADIHLLQEKMKKYDDELFGCQQEIKVNLIESILTQKGAVYKIIE